MSQIEIWLIDMTLSGATTLDESEFGSNGNEGILCIPQNSKIGASPSNCLEPYPGHLLWQSYPSAARQPVCYAAPANWAIMHFKQTRTTAQKVKMCVCVCVCVKMYV